MSYPARITRILHQPGRGILAADIHGGLHRFDPDLRLVMSAPSPATGLDAAGRPVYGISLAGDAIITRDKIGAITRWNAESLAVEIRLDAAATAHAGLLLDGEQPSPTMLRGIGIWQGKAYLNNGYFQLVVLDMSDFSIDRIVPWPHGQVMLEWFCTDAPGVHAVSDRSGRVYLGSLPDLDFPVVVQADTSNVHRVSYDRRHNRFWAIGDAGIGADRNIRNGVVTFGLDGVIEQRMPFARNDVEGLAFSPDFSMAYCGGFDGELLIFDNSAAELAVAHRVGGFSHQIIDVTVGEAGRVYVLTQDGEVTVLSPGGERLGGLGYGRQCVWDLQPTGDGTCELLAATDDGTALVRLAEPQSGHPALIVADRCTDAPGFTRRVTVMDDGWAGICWPRGVRRVAHGQTVWQRELPGIVHTIARSPDGTRLLVACNGGGIELDAATGAETWRSTGFAASVWASAYLPDGQRLLAARNGHLRAFGADGKLTWRAELGSYPKRLIVRDDRVHVTGGGGIREYRAGQAAPDKRFFELLDNTAENCVLIDGTLCVVTYGMQVAAYDYESGELIDLHEDLPDFPKGMAAIRGRHGEAYLVVGGRGGFLRLYRLDRDSGQRVLVPLRDTWLPPSPARQAAALDQAS